MDKLSMEVRLLIAFVLVMIVLGIGQWLSPPPPPDAQKGTTAATAQNANPAAAPNGAASSGQAPKAPPAPSSEPPAQVEASAPETFAIETDHHKVIFSNRGGTIREWILKDYKDSDGKPLELVDQKALTLTGPQALPAPLAFSFRNAPTVDLNSKLFKSTRDADGLGVTFEYSNGAITATKSLQFTKSSYLVKVTSNVIQNGVPLPHGLVWRGGFGDDSGFSSVADHHTLYFDAANNSLVKPTLDPGFFASLFGNGTVVNPVSGNFAFAGLEDKYFAAVALPGQGNSLDLTTYSDKFVGTNGKEEAHMGAALGGSGALTFQLYVGPKDVAHLRSVDPRLEQIVDWGWFGLIARPMFALLHWVTDHVTHNWGWAIVVLTVLINTLLFPLRLSSMKSSKKMQAIQPLVKKINEKYQGLSMSDPRKQNQSQELMDLYKENGINPMGGCIPMVFQIPFFYALYKVLSITIELRGAEWLWISNLSQPETMAIRILPLLLVVTQFLSQRLTPSPGVDPTQQKIMMLMPLMFGYMFWYASAGLVLYWLTSNLVSIGQQLLLNRNTAAPAVAVVVPPKKKK